MTSIRRLLFTLALGAVPFTVLASASEENVAASFAPAASTATFQVHGFLAQGWIRTNENRYFGPSNERGGSFDFRDLGLGVNFKPADNLFFAATGLMRWAGETDDGKARIDSAIADWTFHRNGQDRYALTLGRIKIPFGLYNETRDVATTRPAILLSQSIYFDHSRSYVIAADGVYLYTDQVWANGDTTRIGYMVATPAGLDNTNSEAYFLGMDFPGSLSHKAPAQGLRIVHTMNGGRTTLAAFLSGSTLNYNRGVADPLSAGEITQRNAWLSARHEVGNLGITGELFHTTLRFRNFGLIPDSSLYPLGTALTIDYRFNKEWEGFVRHDVSFADAHDRQGKRLAASSGRPAHNFYAYDTAVGTRYHITPSSSISAEFHKVNGTQWLPVADNPNIGAAKPDWNMFMLQFAYSF